MGYLEYILFLAAAYTWHLRINLSPSMPIGIWQINDTINRGSFVAVCIPLDKPIVQWMFANHELMEGNCPSGIAPLLKTVIGIPGDKVALGWHFIKINDKQYYPVTTRYFQNDSLQTKIVPRGNYYLKTDEYWLMSDYHLRSFDSRYFGNIKRKDIQYGLKPIWVF